VANPRPAYRPPGGWPPSGRIWWSKLLLISNIPIKHCPPDFGKTPDGVLTRLRFRGPPPLLVGPSLLRRLPFLPSLIDGVTAGESQGQEDDQWTGIVQGC
jgi:hypothetical protein